MKIGQMQLSKDETKYFIKLGAGTSSKPEVQETIRNLIQLIGSDVMFLQKPADQIASLEASGHITQEIANERLAKLPEFVKFNVNLPKKQG